MATTQAPGQTPAAVAAAEPRAYTWQDVHDDVFSCLAQLLKICDTFDPSMERRMGKVMVLVWRHHAHFVNNMLHSTADTNEVQCYIMSNDEFKHELVNGGSIVGDERPPFPPNPELTTLAVLYKQTRDSPAYNVFTVDLRHEPHKTEPTLALFANSFAKGVGPGPAPIRT